MPQDISRRTFLAASGAAAVAPLASPPVHAKGLEPTGAIRGRLTGAQACVAALRAQGVSCVFGIPGAQSNELWDEFKTQGMDYLLATHEFSAAAGADGHARVTGRPGVLSTVPGCGLTNSMTGIGEAKLDSVPMVVIVTDVLRGDDYIPFQVHDIDPEALLAPVCKEVLRLDRVDDMVAALHHAFAAATSGEPGPVGVIVEYDVWIAAHDFACPPPYGPEWAFDMAAADAAVDFLSGCGRVGIYAGMGCMACPEQLRLVAEMLDAPVATSVSGKGVIDERHPLSVGWGYGPQGTIAAEDAFKSVDTVLAIGVKYSEVSTGNYAIPEKPRLIHVDACAANIGAVVPADVGVHADAGLFLDHLLAHEGRLRRMPDEKLHGKIHDLRCFELRQASRDYNTRAVDPVRFLEALRTTTLPDCLTFVDVTLSEHFAAAYYAAVAPRTYFNPTDNQSMGWSIPAALGGQKACPGRQVVTITGDGCLLMSGMELSTAVREQLPIKVFVLDDRKYEYMQRLQEQTFRRTTATVLANLNYPAFAAGMGIAYLETDSPDQLRPTIAQALATPGPVLTRIGTDYGDRPVRWLQAVRSQYISHLTRTQQARMLGRLGGRILSIRPDND